MPNKLVSIVLCTYNGSKYLEEQLNSVLAQSYAPLEIVIVDDCSTDNTFDILSAKAATDDRIRLYRNEQNIGYNDNFQKAMKLATGDYISICDQDDIWLPEKTSLLVEALSDPEVSLAHSISIVFHNILSDARLNKLHFHYDGRDPRKFMFFNHVMGHDMMFRRTLLDSVLPVPHRMSYDWWIAFIAVTRGEIRSVPKVMVYHRKHESNSFFNKNSISKKRELDLGETLALLETVPSLDEKSKTYLQRLRKLVDAQTGTTGFRPNMFFFLFKHRNIVFGHKRRAFPLMSHFKNAIKYAKMNFKGRGISI